MWLTPVLVLIIISSPSDIYEYRYAGKRNNQPEEDDYYAFNLLGKRLYDSRMNGKRLYDDRLYGKRNLYSERMFGKRNIYGERLYGKRNGLYDYRMMN